MTLARHRTRTPEHALALYRSVSGDTFQSAAVLAAMAGLAMTHPLAGVASAVAGGAFLAFRRGRPRDPLGRGPGELARLRDGFSLPIGTVASTGEAVALTNDDARQHMMVLGTPGASKTDYLLGLAETSIAAGSGTLFVDAKGDIALWGKIHALAKRNGREDDLLVLNFLPSGAEPTPKGSDFTSNTLNPFATGSSDHLTQLVVSLYPDDGSGDAAMRVGNATALMSGVMRFLVWLRNEGRIVLHAGTIRDHLSFSAVQGAADPANYPDLPEEIRFVLNGYLKYLPGYNAERGQRQPQQTLEYHGVVERELSRVLGVCADAYGHVFRPGLGDVDMTDVVLNRRILLVLLPPPGHSDGDLAILGKMVMATLRTMMTGALGNRIEGTWEDIVDNRVNNSPTPFPCVLDDVGHYALRGLGLAAAQARALGFSMVYGAPDAPGLSLGDEVEGASLQANCNTKLVLRGDEPSQAVQIGSARGCFPTRMETFAFPPGNGDLYMAFKSERILLDAKRPERIHFSGTKLRANHLVTMARPRPPSRDESPTQDSGKAGTR
jgi:intracellular multiplication protein IcmO